MIRVAATCGMCAGAKNAYRKVIETLEQKTGGGRVILYQKLLHNPDVIAELEKRGAVFQETLPEQIEPRDIIVIRAHGGSEAFYAELREKGAAYLDCTCPKVARIHRRIAEKYRAGWSIIIIGERDHAEVAASNGWCGNSARIVSSAKDVAALGRQAGELGGRIFIIAQTTFNDAAFDRLSARLRRLFAGRTVEVENSLCDAQRKIQDEAAALAAEAAAMLILGSRESANTRRLYEKCKAVCAQSYLVDSRSALEKALSRVPAGIVGISAGASTPPRIIDASRAAAAWTLFYREASQKIRRKIAAESAHIEALCAADDPLIKMIIARFLELAQSPRAKCVRAVLIALGFRISGGGGGADGEGGYEYSLELAAAYEFLETAILVHDDVFDNARTRRAVQTIHEACRARYAPRGQAGGGGRAGSRAVREAARAAAICAGDIGFYLVNKKLIDAYRTDERLLDVLGALQEIVTQTIKGETLDILLPVEERAAPRDEAALFEAAQRVNVMKTAAYTTAGPLTLGMRLAGAEAAHIRRIEEYAVHLGVAFQLKDDLLDLFGPAKQGKPRGADIAEHKITCLYALCRRSPAARAALSRYYGKRPSPAALGEIRRVMEESGARAAVEAELSSALEKCRELLAQLEFIPEEEKTILEGFSGYLQHRSA